MRVICGLCQKVIEATNEQPPLVAVEHSGNDGKRCDGSGAVAPHSNAELTDNGPPASVDKLLEHGGIKSAEEKQQALAELAATLEEAVGRFASQIEGSVRTTFEGFEQRLRDLRSEFMAEAKRLEDKIDAAADPEITIVTPTNVPPAIPPL